MFGLRAQPEVLRINFKLKWPRFNLNLKPERTGNRNFKLKGHLASP